MKKEEIRLEILKDVENIKKIFLTNYNPEMEEQELYDFESLYMNIIKNWHKYEPYTIDILEEINIISITEMYMSNKFPFEIDEILRLNEINDEVSNKKIDEIIKNWRKHEKWIYEHLLDISDEDYELCLSIKQIIEQYNKEK